MSAPSDGQTSFYREHLTALGTHHVCRDFARRVAVLVTRRQPLVFPGRCRNWVMHGRGYSGCHRYLTPRVFLRLSKYPASLPMSGCRPVMIIGQLDRLQTVNTHGAVQKKIWFAVQLTLTRVASRSAPTRRCHATGRGAYLPIWRSGVGYYPTSSSHLRVELESQSVRHCGTGDRGAAALWLDQAIRGHVGRAGSDSTEEEDVTQIE